MLRSLTQSFDHRRGADMSTARVLLSISLSIYPLNASACLFGSDRQPFPKLVDLQKAYEMEQAIAPLKARVDAAVWGIFTASYSSENSHPESHTFRVGGHLKGSSAKEIEIISRRVGKPNSYEVYYLNLRRLADGRWTDVGVLQTHFNWDDQACNIDPDSSHCAVQIQKDVKAYLYCENETFYRLNTCKSLDLLPSICRPYLKDIFYPSPNLVESAKGAK